MPRLGSPKQIPLQLKALMDCSSAVESVAAPYHRLVKNATAVNDRGASRLPGWSRYGLLNSDLHDQLVPLVQGYESFSYTSPSSYEVSGYTYQDYHAPYQVYDYYSGWQTYGGSGDFVYTYDITPGYSYEMCGNDIQTRPYCTYDYPTSGAREAITLLEEFTSGEGARHLVAATESRIYALNDASHNWRILADGKAGGGTCGCGTRRFHTAKMGNYLIFTNNYDDVLAWSFDAPVTGCDLQGAQEIADLIELQIRKASVVAEYKGFLFLMNIEVEGQRFVAKAVWSDFGDPLSFVPSNESLASDSDIGDPGEAIIEAKVLGDYLFVYKERSIWRISLVDQDQGLFTMQQVYHGEHVPRYRNTLISTGDAHFFFGPDDIYQFDLYGQAPRVVEWMHNSTRMVFDENLVFSSENLGCGIEKSKCDLAVAGWDPVEQNLWFSWVAKKNSDGTSVSETTKTGFLPQHSVDCTNRSLVFNMRHQSSSYVDHGFSAFGTYRPETRLSLREFLIEMAVCSETEMPEDVKEGQANYFANVELAPSGNYPGGFGFIEVTLIDGNVYNLTAGPNELAFANNSEIIEPGVFTSIGTQLLVSGIPGLPITFSLLGRTNNPKVNSIINDDEDPNQPIAEDSLCAALGGTTFDDICYDCGADTKFLMASSADLSIKQFNWDVSYREFYDFTSNLYSQLGYDTVLESPAMNFGTDSEKTMSTACVEFKPPVQTPTPNLYLRMGNSSQPDCALWWTLQPQPLKCQTDAIQGGTIRPDGKAYFVRLVKGRYLFYRISVTGTTGPTDFSKVELTVRRSEG